MKKTLALILAAVMVFALAACSGDSTKSAATPPPSGTVDTPASNPASGGDTFANLGSGPVTLKVWMDNDDWANKVIEGWNKLYPNVTIDFQNVGNTDSHGKLSLDGPAGVGADVFCLPHDQMPRTINDGLVEPLPADLQARYKSLLLSTAVETASKDGQMYGIPIQVENIALFYNKDLWGPTPPATFEEIVTFAGTYNKPAENKWTIGWSVDDSYHSYLFLTAGGMQLFGPNHDNFKTPGWDTPQAAKGVEYFLRMKQCFDVPVTEANWDNTVARFQRGELPLTITGPWAIGDCNQNGINYGVTKFPTIEGNQPWCFSGVILANVSSYSEQPEWAFKFIDYLVSEEGAGIMYDIKGTMTSLATISNIPGLRDDPYLSGVAEQSPYTVPMPMIPEIDQMWDSQKCLFQFTWDGELTIPEAQDKAMETYRGLLAMAGKSMD
jgi:arabinogalactan oligomer/maltooligosaccharide transport system substrate-binding protein